MQRRRCTLTLFTRLLAEYSYCWEADPETPDRVPNAWLAAWRQQGRTSVRGIQRPSERRCTEAPGQTPRLALARKQRQVLQPSACWR